MTERTSGIDPGSTQREAPQARGRGLLDRAFVLTDMPTWLMLALVALGLPRTILADLGIVPPDSSGLYYVLALTPFAVWLAVAARRRSATPFMDFFVLGVAYGLSLVIVHQVLWDVGPSLGHNPPAGAVAFAERFGPTWDGIALRVYTSGIAMVIGVGSGFVAALVAVVAHAWRAKRVRH